MWDDNIKHALLPHPDGITLIITIGNPFRHDDGAGNYIADKLEEIEGLYRLIDAGDKPENIIDEAIEMKPSKTIFIDAADFSGETGDLRVIDEAEIPVVIMSTHQFPLPVISRIISDESQSETVYLGIQVRDVSFGEGMCAEVKNTAIEIINFIKENNSHA